MAELLQVGSGWTAKLGPFVLRIDGAAIDLTGFTITMELKKWGATSWSTGGGLIEIAPNQVANRGELYYTPLATDFVWTSSPSPKQLYLVRFRVVDTINKVATFPNGDPDTIAVY
jgi:hypothetical protein